MPSSPSLLLRLVVSVAFLSLNPLADNFLGSAPRVAAKSESNNCSFLQLGKENKIPFDLSQAYSNDVSTFAVNSNLSPKKIGKAILTALPTVTFLKKIAEAILTSLSLPPILKKISRVVMITLSTLLTLSGRAVLTILSYFFKFLLLSALALAAGSFVSHVDLTKSFQSNSPPSAAPSRFPWVCIRCFSSTVALQQQW